MKSGMSVPRINFFCLTDELMLLLMVRNTLIKLCIEMVDGLSTEIIIAEAGRDYLEQISCQLC